VLISSTQGAVFQRIPQSSIFQLFTDYSMREFTDLTAFCGADFEHSATLFQAFQNSPNIRFCNSSTCIFAPFA
jgi:hypothetical protein